MAGLSLQQLCKRYGAVEAIPPLDLEIHDGEFCVFVGPSGCGKSTLLRSIAGLEDISEGNLYIGEREVSRVHPGERGVAMVFQNYALYPHMTVRENMGYALKLAKESKAQIKQKVERAAEILGLEKLLDRKPSDMSGGQRQRVAIGRAIVRDPKVFLFDEPLSNLDAELRTRMRLELAELHRRLGATMIYVTHDQIEAMTLADRIVVLRAGKIEQVGSPMELYDRPVNLFVARFIGSPSMDIIEVSADHDVLTSPDFEGPLLSRPGHLPQGWSGLAGIRPEHLIVDDNGARLKLNAVEQLGGVTYGYAVLKSGAEICVELGDRRGLSAGDEIGIAFPEGKTHFFDRTTEQRLGQGEQHGGEK